MVFLSLKFKSNRIIAWTVTEVCIYNENKLGVFLWKRLVRLIWGNLCFRLSIKNASIYDFYKQFIVFILPVVYEGNIWLYTFAKPINFG